MNKKKVLMLLVLPLLFSCKPRSGSNVNISTSQSGVEQVSNSQLSNNDVTSNSVVSIGNNSQNPIYESTIRPNVIANGLEVIKAEGGLETAYIEWKNVENANRYEVLYKSTSSSNFIKADDMLIRNYGDYSRVDILGLKEGQYDVQINTYNDDGSKSNATSNVQLSVLKHIREGFGFYNGSASGAYNDDGTLKDNCDVVYVTKKNAKTVSLTIEGKVFTGVQDILYAKENLGSTKPMCIRFIGRIDAADLDRMGSSEEGLQIKGKKANQNMNLTVEGVGNDTTIYGFGILIRNSANVEVRNLGFMNAMDDCVSIDTDNSHLWVHNNDFFYGKKGSGDKAKGDGALDTKLSTLITHSFNHFWDSGKCNLQGMKAEKPEYSITYHHNWFDHSDSRHPRVRTSQVHVYNNYYDGNAKYGVGATSGASVFVEANYFRNCQNPMLISLQGSDIKYDPKAEGTFSGEEGAIIKSFANHIEGGRTPVTYQVDPVEFDCYEASSRNEVIPSTVASKSGSHVYNNFDSNETMYSYTVESAEQAKTTTTSYAGRVEGGDFEFTFTEADDKLYSLNEALVSKIANYKSKLVFIQGEELNNNNNNDDGGNTTTSQVTSESVSQQQGTSNVSQNPTSNQVVSQVQQGEIVHNFTTNGLVSSFFQISGNLSTSKGTVNYNGLTLTQCLKVESDTKIKFNLTETKTITLVFNPDFSKGIYIDSTKYTASNGLLSVELKAGDHTITKGDTCNIYYISVN